MVTMAKTDIPETGEMVVPKNTFIGSEAVPGGDVHSFSGFYRVSLSKVVEIAGHKYRPNMSHTVNQETLDAMTADDAVLDKSEIP